MGWTYKFVGTTDKTPKQLMTEELEQYGSEKVIKASVVRGVYYAAVRNERNGKINGVVCLMRKQNGEFGWKDIWEEMGPFESRCPKVIIDLLSPTDSEYAKQWRERCIANAKGSRIKELNALPIGAMIEANGRVWYKRAPAHQYKTPYFSDRFDCIALPKSQITSFRVLD